MSRMRGYRFAVSISEDEGSSAANLGSMAGEESHVRSKESAWCDPAFQHVKSVPWVTTPPGDIQGFWKSEAVTRRRSWKGVCCFFESHCAGFG